MRLSDNLFLHENSCGEHGIRVISVLDSLGATARVREPHRWELQHGLVWRPDRCTNSSQEREEYLNDPNERPERFRPAKRQQRCPTAPPCHTHPGLTTPFRDELTEVRTWHLMYVVIYIVYVVKTTNTTVRSGGSYVSSHKAASPILPKGQQRRNRNFALCQLQSPALLLDRPFKRCDCHSVKRMLLNTAS